MRSTRFQVVGVHTSARCSRRCDPLPHHGRSCGTLALSLQPRGKDANAAATDRAAAEISDIVERSGFGSVETRYLDIRPPVVAVLARI